jgi:hypothetical protein
MSDDLLYRAFTGQSEVCARFGAPFYAGLTARAAADLAPQVRALFAPWAGCSYEGLIDAAVTLRFLGAAHDLALSGEAPALTEAFPPRGDADRAWVALRAAIERDPGRFYRFMAHEPQTNEVRRSACLLPGFLTIAAETRLPLACFELGASAGLNQLWSRYAYDYGAAGRWGDAASPVKLTAEWTGPAPPLGASLELARVSACDRDPVDLTHPAQRSRLAAYLWPDQIERRERFEAAAEMAISAGVRVEAADAAAWTKATAAPSEGVATVVYHSVMWPYLPPEAQTELRGVVERYGRAATPSAPFAWLRMEAQAGRPFPIELRLTLWHGGADRLLAIVHAHGSHVDWKA